MPTRSTHREDRKKQVSTLKEKRAAKKAKNEDKPTSLTMPTRD
jgi:hypothetical protein